jgi:hypothetical protein
VADLIFDDKWWLRSKGLVVEEDEEYEYGFDDVEEYP